MKTILVIYEGDLSKVREEMYAKRYSFNTEDDVKVGDVLKSNAYSSNMKVVEVLEEGYKYFNLTDGSFSNKVDNSALREIKNLKIMDKTDTLTVVATRVSRVEDKEDSTVK